MKILIERLGEPRKINKFKILEEKNIIRTLLKISPFKVIKIILKS